MQQNKGVYEAMSHTSSKLDARLPKQTLLIAGNPDKRGQTDVFPCIHSNSSGILLPTARSQPSEPKLAQSSPSKISA